MKQLDSHLDGLRVVLTAPGYRIAMPFSTPQLAADFAAVWSDLFTAIIALDGEECSVWKNGQRVSLTRDFATPPPKKLRFASTVLQAA